MVWIAYMGVSGCGAGKTTGEVPIHRLKKNLEKTPTYSIVLEDMREEGNFIKKYYHQYRIVVPDNIKQTEWLEVPEDYYRHNAGFLGMTLAAKKEGQEVAGVAPPGYAYVGDSRYGRWREDGRGGSFWEWYGKYALFSTLFGGWYRPIYRTDYNTYRDYSRSKRPYFGRSNQYGTSGTVARQNKPDFFTRQQARMRSGKQSFKDRVSRRIGRSRTGFRGRSGGFGK